MAKRKHRGSSSGRDSSRPFHSDSSDRRFPSGKSGFGKKAETPPRRGFFQADRPAGGRPADGRYTDRAEQPAHPVAENRNRPGRGPARHQLWIYGLHAVKAALANPRRRHHRLLLTQEAFEAIRENISNFNTLEGISREIVAREEITRVLPPGAVHQGVALLTEPLANTALEDALEQANQAETSVVVVLDQVTDPRNVGAILRSAAAFGADAVLVPDRHAPPETGALVKAASGGIEVVPLIRVVNLARALEDLKQAGFWIVGLDGRAPRTLAAADLSGKVALVLGAEGEGLRRLTRDHCDILARLPISDRMESLNVSAAAAVALYELACKA